MMMRLLHTDNRCMMTCLCEHPLSQGRVGSSRAAYPTLSRRNFAKTSWPFATFDDAVSRCDASSNAGEPIKLNDGFLNRTPMTNFIKSGERPASSGEVCSPAQRAAGCAFTPACSQRFSKASSVRWIGCQGRTQGGESCWSATGPTPAQPP